MTDVLRRVAPLTVVAMAVLPAAGASAQAACPAGQVPEVTNGRLSVKINGGGCFVRKESKSKKGDRLFTSWSTNVPNQLVLVNGTAWRTVTGGLEVRQQTKLLPAGKGVEFALFTIAAPNATVTGRLGAQKLPVVELDKGSILWSMRANVKGDKSKNWAVDGFNVTNPNAFAVGMSGRLAGRPTMLANKTMSIPYRLVLPDELGGVTSPAMRAVQTQFAGATAKAAQTGQGEGFNVPAALIGDFFLTDLNFKFDGTGWGVAARMELPAPGKGGNFAVALRVEDKKVRFLRAQAGFNDPGLKLGPTAVKCLRFELQFSPTIGIPQGQCDPAAPVQPKGGCSPTFGVQKFETVKGSFADLQDGTSDGSITIDHGPPPTFGLCGDTKFTAFGLSVDGGFSFADYDGSKGSRFVARAGLSLPTLKADTKIADAEIEVHSSGYIRLAGGVDYQLPGVARIDGRLEARYKGKKFQISGRARVCSKELKAAIEDEFPFITTFVTIPECIGGVAIIVSSKGAAVCIDTIDGLPDVGVGLKDSGPEILLSCDLSTYNAVKASSAQAGLRTYKVAAGESGVQFLVKGTGPDGGLPKFRVAGPRGAITTPADNGFIEQPAVSLTQGKSGTLVTIRRPAAGNYTVTPATGTTIADVAFSRLSRTTLKAAVRRSAGASVLQYQATVEPGETVTLYETGNTGAGRIATFTKTAKGVVGFAAAEGVAERRALTATIERAGEPVAEVLIGSYNYVPPTVPTPKFALKRANGQVQASLQRAPIAGLALDPADPGAVVRSGKRVPFRGSLQKASGVQLEPVAPASLAVKYLVVTETSDGGKSVQLLTAPTVASPRTSLVKGPKLASEDGAKVTITAITPGGARSAARTSSLKKRD